MRKQFIGVLATIALAGGLALAGEAPAGSDWPNYLGPNFDLSSPEKGLLREWPKDGPQVLWRAPIGQGWNAPAAAGDDVVLSWTGPGRQSATEEGTICLNTATGKEKWRDTYKCPPYWKAGIGWGAGGVRATPCITEKYVYSLGATGILRCLNRKDGKLVWDHELAKDYAMAGEKGWSFSPVVTDGKLIIWLGDGMDANKPGSTTKPKSAEDFTNRLVVCQAYDLDTGKLEWEWKVPHRESSRRGEGQTPIVTRYGDQDCVVLTGQTAFVCLRAKDGKELWRLDGDKGARGTNGSPLMRVGDMYLGVQDFGGAMYYYFSATQKSGSNDFDVKVEKKTRLNVGGTSVTGGVQHDGYLYTFAGDYPPDFPGKKGMDRGDGGFTCFDIKTGKIQWREKGFKCSGSVILADGLIFGRAFQTLLLIEPSPKGYVEKGRFKTHDQAEGYASMCDFVTPVLSHGRLFIRTGTEVLCLKVSK